MNKHTPGPWSIAYTFNIVGADGRRGVANTGGYSENRNQEACHEENIANANLIAAAPDLLAALRDALECMEIAEKVRNPSWDGEAVYFSSIGKARAVIAKAEGTQ